MIRLVRNRIEISRTLNCSAESAWLLLIDTRLWNRWGPSISSVRSARRFIAPHSTGSVLTLFRIWLPFTIIEYNEPTFWKWKIGRIPATGHRVTRLDEKHCEVAFDMDWWAFPYVIVCGVALRRLQEMAESRS